MYLLGMEKKPKEKKKTSQLHVPDSLLVRIKVLQPKIQSDMGLVSKASQTLVIAKGIELLEREFGI